jgi:hypothetical protein
MRLGTRNEAAHLEEVVGGAGFLIRADFDFVHQTLWVMPGIIKEFGARRLP